MCHVIAVVVLALLKYVEGEGRGSLQHCLHQLNQLRKGSVCSAWREGLYMHFCWWSAADSLVFRLQTYIDFEISEGNRDRARKLYERLLARTKHVKVRTNEPAMSKRQQLLVTITLVPEGVACTSACFPG